MKKLLMLMSVVAMGLAASSCAKDLMSPVDPAAGSLRTITLGFEQTKTTISDEGVTLWSKGDSLWVTNGTEVEAWYVPAEADGLDVCQFQTTLQGDLKIVYPYSASLGLTADGKFKINVPSTVDGPDFAKANIAVAVVSAEIGEGEASASTGVKMKNATGVVKFSISESAMYPPKAVGLSAPGQIIAGECTVDLSSGTPQVSCTSGSSMILVTGTEGGGTFYAAVVPVELQPGFRYIGVGVDLDCESIASTKANKIEANDLFDLGEFGTRQLTPLEGEGTEGSPYLIHNLPEWLAMTYFVNESPDNTLAGKYFKIADNIAGISIPVGTFANNLDYYFCGKLDGNGKTLTVDIVGGKYQALFGELGEGAEIRNLTLAGSVKGGDCSAAFAGCVNAGANVVFENCVNNASVTGGAQVAGIAAYADAGVAAAEGAGLHFIKCTNNGVITGTGNSVGGIVGQTSGAFNKEFKECANTGAVTGNNSVGGIVGYGYYDIFTSCTNSGDINATQATATSMYGLSGSSFTHFTGYNNGVGGIVGWAQNCNWITGSKNTGAVTGPNKVGGIAGVTYWTGVKDSENTGAVTGKVAVTHGINFGSATGGIVGWIDCRYDVLNCKNSGTITAKGGCGGIVGVSQATTSATVNITNCENSADIVSTGESAGGIVGIGWNQAGAKYNVITSCTNSGKVSSTTNSAGGICGKFYDANNAKQGYINKCANTGDVSAQYYAGGVVGYCQTRATGPTWYIRNCENHGNVLSTRTDAQPAYSGGIVGNAHGYAPGLMLFNCYNTGKVQYTTTFKQPSVGGIVGSTSKGEIYNVYNSGVVCPVEGEPTEETIKHIGGVVGTAGATIKYAYWLNSACDRGLGANYTPDASVVAVNEAGALTEPVEVAGASYTSLVDALNGWVGENATYLNWIEGPKFVTE